MILERVRVVHPSGGPLKVKRAEQDSTDVNLIMDSWIQGSAMPANLNPGVGRYGDFSSGIDYATALNSVRDAESAFAALPPKVRNHCDNDPGKLLDMVFDPDRRDELEELGLVQPAELEREAEEEPIKEKAPEAPEKESPGEPSSPEGSDLTK